MSKNKQQKNMPAEQNEQPAEIPAENPQEMPAPESAPVITPEELETITQQLEAAQAQVEEYKDGWQRAVADFANYKKRVEQERQQMYQTATGDIIKYFLPIVDDLELALQNKQDSPWADGIELIYRKLQAILEANHVQRIEAEGQMFDPNLHEAISHEPSPEHASGEIIAVVQQGYMLGERVIRPARVRVAQ